MPYHIRRHPRKRVTPYSRAVVVDRRGRSVLKRTVSLQLTTYPPPYSAGLAAGGGGDAGGAVDEAAEAAAFFSTIPTAMIEPS